MTLPGPAAFRQIVAYNENSRWLYFTHHTKATHAEAVQICADLKMTLPLPTNAIENAFLQTMTKGAEDHAGDLWLRLDRTSDTMFDDSNNPKMPLLYSNFATNQPNNFKGIENKVKCRCDGAWNDRLHRASRKGGTCYCRFGVIL